MLSQIKTHLSKRKTLSITHQHISYHIFILESPHFKDQLMFSRVPRYTYYCSNLFISSKQDSRQLYQSQLLTISGGCINRHTKLKIKLVPRIKSFPKAISGRHPSHHLPNPVNTFPKQIHIPCLYQSSFHSWL